MHVFVHAGKGKKWQLEREQGLGTSIGCVGDLCLIESMKNELIEQHLELSINQFTTRSVRSTQPPVQGDCRVPGSVSVRTVCGRE